MNARVCLALIALAAATACGGGGNATPLGEACEMQFRIDDEFARGDISKEEYFDDQFGKVFEPALQLHDNPDLTPEESAVTVVVKRYAESRNLPKEELELLIEDLRSACRALLDKE